MGRQQLVSLFLGQSSEDIRRKLQKLKEPDIRDLEKLIEEACRVYRYRERDEKEKLGTAIAIATVTALGRQGNSLSGRGRGNRNRRGARQPLKSDQRAYCKETGHWKGECPKLENCAVVANVTSEA